MRVIVNKRIYKVPNQLVFESGGVHRLMGRPQFYRVSQHREPKKGEFYLSGAIVQAYCAPNDLPMAYLIAQPLNINSAIVYRKNGKLVGDIIKAFAIINDEPVALYANGEWGFVANITDLVNP